MGGKCIALQDIHKRYILGTHRRKQNLKKIDLAKNRTSVACAKRPTHKPLSNDRSYNMCPILKRIQKIIKTYTTSKVAISQTLTKNDHPLSGSTVLNGLLKFSKNNVYRHRSVSNNDLATSKQRINYMKNTLKKLHTYMEQYTV